MASFSSTYPAQRAIFSLDAANAGRLDPRMTFSRASTGTYFGTEKVLSSENLLPYSENSGLWSQSGLLSRTGGQTDPAGGSTGFTLRENSSAGFHRIYQNVASAATGDLAFTVYAKQNSGTRYLTLTLSNVNNDWVGATFDLAGGAAATSSGSSSSFSGLTATQIASGSSYYKCTIKATGSITGVVASLSDSTSAPSGTYGLPSYTGDGSSSIDVSFSSLSTTGATDYSFTNGQIARSYQTKLQTAASGVARFEHSATDGQSVGILIEGQTTNLCPYGSDQSNWLSARRLLQSNAAVSPAGTLTADLVTLNDTDATSHYVYQNVSVTSGTTYTYSQYVKAAGLNYIGLRTFAGFASNYVWFNLSNGTITSNAGGLSASINSVSGGWYRVTVTAPATSTTSGNVLLYFSETENNANTATGDSYRGILLWGAQWEASSFASSLVDTGTSSSTVTRAAESLSMPIASTGYTGGPVTLLADSTTETATNNPVTIMMYVDGDNQIILYGKSPNKRAAYVEADGSPSTLTAPSAANGVRALSIDTNDIATALNGTVDVTDTSQTLPDLTGATVYIGDDSNGGNSIDGHIKRVAIYNEALSDTNLQAITS